MGKEGGQAELLLCLWCSGQNINSTKQDYLLCLCYLTGAGLLLGTEGHCTDSPGQPVKGWQGLRSLSREAEPSLTEQGDESENTTDGGDCRTQEHPMPVSHRELFWEGNDF